MSSAIKLDSEPIFLKIISFGAAAVHIRILSYRSTSDKTTNSRVNRLFLSNNIITFWQPRKEN